MSTLNVANISDDQSTLTGANENPTDKLHFNKTVDTKFVTNGCAKAYSMYSQTHSTIYESLNISTITDDSEGEYTQNYTNGFSGSDFRTRVYGGMAPSARVVQFTGTSSTMSTQFRVANTTTNVPANTNSSVTVHGDLA